MTGLSPWDPQGSRPRPEQQERQGPDPDPIVRRVRLNFLLSGILAVAMVTVGMRPFGEAEPLAAPSQIALGAMAAVVLAILAVAWRNLRPSALLDAGKRAVTGAGPRERQPRAERARATGFLGLALSWTMQAIALAMLPVFTGLLLQLLHRQRWPLVLFSALGIAAGVLYQHRIATAVRRAVDDPDLQSVYGSR